MKIKILAILLGIICANLIYFSPVYGADIECDGTLVTTVLTEDCDVTSEFYGDIINALATPLSQNYNGHDIMPYINNRYWLDVFTLPLLNSMGSGLSFNNTDLRYLEIFTTTYDVWDLIFYTPINPTPDMSIAFYPYESIGCVFGNFGNQSGCSISYTVDGDGYLFKFHSVDNNSDETFSFDGFNPQHIVLTFDYDEVTNLTEVCGYRDGDTSGNCDDLILDLTPFYSLSSYGTEIEVTSFTSPIFKIDELVIFSKTLSPDEVDTFFNDYSGIANDSDCYVIASWHFNANLNDSSLGIPCNESSNFDNIIWGIGILFFLLSFYNGVKLFTKKNK